MADKRNYQRRVSQGLDRAHARVPVEERDVDGMRIVILSDLHRGARDGADDFQRCEPAYDAALGWYLEHDYELFLLGDVEELWENDAGEVLPRYADTAALERAFAAGPGLRRFYGNHDCDWADPKRVRRLLEPRTGVTEVLEGLRLVVSDGGTRLGEIFLVHGHQGTGTSDRWAWLSRIALRRVWRKLQARLGWLSTTPSQDHDLRHVHDQAMFLWARGRVLDAPPDEALALIAGHTHHTVFPGRSRERPDSAEIARSDEDYVRAAPDDRPAARAALEWARAAARPQEVAPWDDDPPCYFNTGCCCFPDRYVTGLELADGEIRLIEWRGDDGQREPTQLATLAIREVLGCLATA